MINVKKNTTVKIVIKKHTSIIIFYKLKLLYNILKINFRTCLSCEKRHYRVLEEN